MKTIFFILSVIIVLLSVSCNNSSDNNSGAGANKPKTKVDSLMDDIMAGHGASMAKLNKLSVFKAKIQHAIDSMKALPEKTKKASELFRKILDSAKEKLNAAEESMNKWMDEFSIDSLENNVAERIKYLESEKSKVSKVQDALNSSTGKADSLLKRLIRQ